MFGVLAWGAKMPPGFPVDVPQNSGNMVHARAPFSLFQNAVGQDYGYKAEGYDSFTDFVNDRCEALIVPFANTIRLDESTDSRGPRHVRSLSKFTVPIIPFGLGAQAPRANLDEFDLGPGMREFVRYLSDHAAAISVRGDFTYQIFERYGSVDKVFVTGCPSYFSRPEAFSRLKQRLEQGSGFQRVAFAGSLHHTADNKSMLYSAINEDAFLVEPVNAFLHSYYLECLQGTPKDVPYFLKDLLRSPDWDLKSLREYMMRRYQLFRDLDSWIAFNQESVDGTAGTRFHVNMASVLSGVPAVWTVHDSRVEELCRKLALPSVSVDEALSGKIRDHLERADFGPMFDSLSKNFGDFNEFLRAARLPEVSLPSLG